MTVIGMISNNISNNISNEGYKYICDLLEGQNNI